MTMHGYTITPDNRQIPTLMLGVLSVFVSLILNVLIDSVLKSFDPMLTIPWWVETPSPLVVFGVLFGLFDKYAWKWPMMRILGLTHAPDLSGRWEGELTSSYDPNSNTRVVLEVKQTWTQITLKISTGQSHSWSSTAAIDINSLRGTILRYEYCNEPQNSSADTMNMHYGTTRLLIKKHSLEGGYYTDKNRRSFGDMKFKRS